MKELSKHRLEAALKVAKDCLPHACEEDDHFWQTSVAALQFLIEPQVTDEMGIASAMPYKCSCGKRITQWGCNKLPEMIQALTGGDNDGR